VHVRADPPPVLVVAGYKTFYGVALTERVDELGSNGRICFTGWAEGFGLPGSRRSSAWDAGGLFERVVPTGGRRRGRPLLRADRYRGDHRGDRAPSRGHGAPRPSAHRRTRAGAKVSWRRTAEGTLASYERVLAIARS
jgi:hypothetical protein